MNREEVLAIRKSILELHNVNIGQLPVRINKLIQFIDSTVDVSLRRSRSPTRDYEDELMPPGQSYAPNPHYPIQSRLSMDQSDRNLIALGNDLIPEGVDRERWEHTLSVLLAYVRGRLHEYELEKSVANFVYNNLNLSVSNIDMQNRIRELINSLMTYLSKLRSNMIGRSRSSSYGLYASSLYTIDVVASYLQSAEDVFVNRAKRGTVNSNIDSSPIRFRMGEDDDDDEDEF